MYDKGYALAMEVLKNTPDVREDKVLKVKKALSEGAYNVDAKEFANKLLNSPNK